MLRTLAVHTLAELARVRGQLFVRSLAWIAEHALPRLNRFLPVLSCLAFSRIRPRIASKLGHCVWSALTTSLNAPGRLRTSRTVLITSGTTSPDAEGLECARENSSTWLSISVGEVSFGRKEGIALDALACSPEPLMTWKCFHAAQAVCPRSLLSSSPLVCTSCLESTKRAFKKGCLEGGREAVLLEAA